MPNLRIVHSNALDRTSSFAVSSEALPKDNLRDQRKSMLWRSTMKTASMVLQWTNVETIRVVCLPHTNLTTSATITVRGYTNVGDPTPLFTVGPLSCTKYSPVNPWGFEALPAGINQYAYGGGSYAILWFTGGAVRRLEIDINDGTNASNIEAAALVVGDYWSPERNPGYGAGVTIVDTSKPERAESGDLITNRGTRYRKLNMTLAQMTENDRTTLHSILRHNGTHRPMLVSLYPEDSSAQKEWDHMVWAKMSQISALTQAQYSLYSNNIELEEI